MATYYMTNRSCPYSKSILERAFEGGYNFLDALIGQECCCTMNRMEQYFEYCGLIPKEKFFVACIDMPINRSEWHVGYYRRQMEKKILEPAARRPTAWTSRRNACAPPSRSTTSCAAS